MFPETSLDHLPTAVGHPPTAARCRPLLRAADRRRLRLRAPALFVGVPQRDLRRRRPCHGVRRRWLQRTLSRKAEKNQKPPKAQGAQPNVPGGIKKIAQIIDSQRFSGHTLCPPPLCDIPSGCCSFTGPWTVTRSSLRMLRRVAVFCRPLRPVLLLVSFPRSRSPVVGVLGLCWMWRDVPFACQRRPIVGVLRMCWLLPGSFDCFCCPHTSVHRPSIACLAVFL